jgi:hypothetical protein
VIDLLEWLGSQHDLPEGCDAWGIRTRASQGGFLYPTEGWSVAPGPILGHDGVSPAAPGDGVCIAYTWAGLATIRLPAASLMLVAYGPDDLLSRRDPNTARLKRMFVVDNVDGADLIRYHAMGANLAGANLAGMDLRNAELFGADLTDANLEGTNLSGASLYAASLHGAFLNGANLLGTNLKMADLRFARLVGAAIDASTSVYAADLQSMHEPSGKVFGASFR